MDAPKCRLCGDRHWGLCRAAEAIVPRAAPVTVEVVSQPPKPEAELKVEGFIDVPRSVPLDTGRQRRWRAANRERYNETMRAYRAKKRAAQ